MVARSNDGLAYITRQIIPIYVSRNMQVVCNYVGTGDVLSDHSEFYKVKKLQCAFQFGCWFCGAFCEKGDSALGRQCGYAQIHFLEALRLDDTSNDNFRFVVWHDCYKFTIVRFAVSPSLCASCWLRRLGYTHASMVYLSTPCQ